MRNVRIRVSVVSVLGNSMVLCLLRVLVSSANGQVLLAAFATTIGLSVLLSIQTAFGFHNGRRTLGNARVFSQLFTFETVR